MKIFHPLEKIVESRFVGEAKPDECERKTIAEFEKKKKRGKLEFAPLWSWQKVFLLEVIPV